MDAGRKNAPPVMKPPGYAAVAVDDFDIAVTVIERIAVDKTKVTARNSMGADAVTGEQGNLHSVIGNEEVSSPTQDFMLHIKEQIVGIKLQRGGRIKIVDEKTMRQIDRSMAVNAVIPEIGKHNPLIKRKCIATESIIFRGKAAWRF